MSGKSNFDQVMERLDRIRPPSLGFIVFWLGAVPFFGFMAALLFFGR